MKQMLNTLNISEFISKCTSYIYIIHIFITSVLQYSAFCVSRITINKLFDTILYHDTIMKWSWLVITGIIS